jgi:hypothetical protein
LVRPSSWLTGAGQKLAYVYFEDEPGRRSVAKLLSAPGPIPQRAKVVALDV